MAHTAEIIVVSKRKDGPKAPAGYTVIDITRTGSWGLGNPYPLLAKGNMDARMESLGKHIKYVEAQFDVKGDVYQKLVDIANRFKKGESFALECWCEPLPCHGRYYRKMIYMLAGIPLPEGDAFVEDKKAEPPQMALF